MGTWAVKNPSQGGGVNYVYLSVVGSGTAASPYVFNAASVPYVGTPLGYQQITAGTLAAATSLTVPAGATFAYIVCEAANVRWRDDGTAPTASIGMVLASGGNLEYSANLAAIQFILVSGSPQLDISYYK